MLCLCIREPLHVRGPAGKGQAGDFLHHRAQRRKCERGVDRPAHPRQIKQRVIRMDGVEHDRRAGAGASPWKSSRGTMPLTATRTAADALLSPCVPATR